MYNSIQRYNTCTIVHIRILFGQSPNNVGSYVCNLGNRPYVHYATYKIYECCNILFPYVRSPILYDSARYFVVRVVYLFFCRSLVVCLLLLFARLPPHQLIIFSLEHISHLSISINNNHYLLIIFFASRIARILALSRSCSAVYTTAIVLLLGCVLHRHWSLSAISYCRSASPAVSSAPLVVSCPCEILFICSSRLSVQSADNATILIFWQNPEIKDFFLFFS